MNQIPRIGNKMLPIYNTLHTSTGHLKGFVTVSVLMIRYLGVFVINCITHFVFLTGATGKNEVIDLLGTLIIMTNPKSR